MMRNFIINCFFLGLSMLATTQGNYYSGYQDGFKSECKCIDVPSKNQAMTLGNYNEGYIDGKIDGRIYINSNDKSNQSSQYERKPYEYKQHQFFKQDYELLERALQNKQTSYNSNRERVQQKIDGITGTIKTLRDNENIDAIANRMSRIYIIENEFFGSLNKINATRVDYSNNNTTSQVLNILNQYSNQLSDLVREIKIEYNQTVNRIDQIKKLYDSFGNKDVKVQNGWHTVYATNNQDICNIRKVYVENNRIIKYVREGLHYKAWEYNGIEYSKEITNCKTTIKLPKGNDFLEIYFINVLTNPSEFSLPPDPTGKVSFWTNYGKGKVLIFVEDQHIGTLENYFSGKAPDCGKSGTVTYTNKAGTYNFVAKSNGFSWSGTFTVYTNNCVNKKLAGN